MISHRVGRDVLVRRQAGVGARGLPHRVVGGDVVILRQAQAAAVEAQVLVVGLVDLVRDGVELRPRGVLARAVHGLGAGGCRAAEDSCQTCRQEQRATTATNTLTATARRSS